MPPAVPASPPGADRLLTVPRDADARPGPATPWREVRAVFLVPEGVRDSSAAVAPLLDDPELHFTPGLRRGQLALLPRAGALVRLVLTWEWSVEAAAFAVQSFGDDLGQGDLVAVEAWVRRAARTLVSAERALDDAVARVVTDAADGLATSRPPRPLVELGPGSSSAGPVTGEVPAPARDDAGTDDATGSATAAPRARLVPVDAVLVTRLAAPEPRDHHARVDVVVPDESAPGREAFVEARSGRVLGERRTVEHEGLATAFTYRVADGAEGVTTAHLRHWHGQHLHAQMLAEDARQAYVHLLAGLDAPVSVRYA